MSNQKPDTSAISETRDQLQQIVLSELLQQQSDINASELHSMTERVSRIIMPAGDASSFILSGLARLSERQNSLEHTKKEVNNLFNSLQNIMGRTMNSALFVGPATVLWGYQNLLKLSGKDPDEYFPEGLWQFYLDYALREDTARHTHETNGFDLILSQYHVNLNQADRMSAWVISAIHMLDQYPEILRNEWRERVYTRVLRDVTRHELNAAYYTHLYQQWEKLKPYRRGVDALPHHTFATYRRLKFDRFLEPNLNRISTELRQQWLHYVEELKSEDLPAYQKQMSISAYLKPDTYGETRVPIPPQDLCIGIIYQGRYYLIPVYQPDTLEPVNVNTIRQQMVGLIQNNSEIVPLKLTPLADIKRTALVNLLETSPSIQKAINAIHQAPIWLNFDQKPSNLPLVKIRQGERGVGDHPLTIFDTDKTFVFDFSHIFFDGAWGAAFAEFMTNEALSWARYIYRLPSPKIGSQPLSVSLELTDEETATIIQAPRTIPEVGVETQVVNLKAMLTLREGFKRHKETIKLTINDLLILYRAIHAVSYEPDPNLIEELNEMSQNPVTQQAAQTALEAIHLIRQVNPAILIPVASVYSPKDRLYPMSFEVPLQELNLIALHEQVVRALEEYEGATDLREKAYKIFDARQKEYLVMLEGFGSIFAEARRIATRGESTSTGVIKLLAHIPTPLQRLLDRLPNRFEVLNDILKGKEVFSNLGAVVPTSSLTRFITAKDDNQRKHLCWGVITTATGKTSISLRDFRPHVGLFLAIGQEEIVVKIAQDYLDSYAHGLNRYVQQLHQIMQAVREAKTFH